MTDEFEDTPVRHDVGDESGASPERTGPTEPASATDDAHLPEPVAAPAEKSGGAIRWLLETVAMVALAFLLAQGIKAYVLQPFVVPTGSMETTIMTGDRVLSEKISYYFEDPQTGDIVVFDDPQGRHPQLIKRVIATEGQTVDIADGVVLVDGEALSEPYLDGVTTEPGSEPLPITIAEGQVWLMGDNRPNSGDSRFIGAQPVSSVNARAFATYWPLDRIGLLE
jgi:signal peptidase I